MATNYIQDGKQIELVAPTGGVEAGKPYAIGALVVVALADAPEDAPFVGVTGGVWEIEAAASLTAGAAVGLKDGEIVAAATTGAVPCGYVLDATGSSSTVVRVLLK